MKFKMKKIIKDDSKNKIKENNFVRENLINVSFNIKESNEIWIFDDDYLTSYNEK